MSEKLTTDILSQAAELEHMHPKEILRLALNAFSPQISIAFSGAEDVVLIDMAKEAALPFRVFSLDTGRLHPETYEFFGRVRERYKLELETFFPQFKDVERLVREKGPFSFYRDGHKECCQIRKVEPLRRALSGARAWVTGVRRDQSPSTRALISVVERDPSFSVPGRILVKFNPMAHWSSKQVWSYIREHEVPFNSLHERGFVSIGCQPCTRPVLPGQHEREGRWWWEDETRRECGLHTEGAQYTPKWSASNPWTGCDTMVEQEKPLDAALDEA